MNPQPVPAPPAPESDRERFYADDARWYQSTLTLEDIMESTAQGTQREITLASFAVIRHARPDVQCFNELLIQYPIAGQTTPGRVVPDNFVVVHPARLGPMGSFPTEIRPTSPFLVMEYVSKNSDRKDYDRNLEKYEQALRVPYYLIFYPDHEEFTLFRLAGVRYSAVHPDEAGRCALPELEMAVGMIDGWVRYWFRGELVPLPGELADRAAASERRAAEAEQRATAGEREREAAEQRAAGLEAEIARLREELARGKAAG